MRLFLSAAGMRNLRKASVEPLERTTHWEQPCSRWYFDPHSNISRRRKVYPFHHPNTIKTCHLLGSPSLKCQTMKVVIEPHNPAWEAEFARVRDDLHKILEDVPILSIEHVGSTSIPGLSAKPVLDIDIVVTPDTLAATRAALIAAGYVDFGEMGVPGRVAFRQPGHEHSQAATGLIDNSSAMRRNTYVILEGSAALKNHRDLKRVLMQDVALRKEYGDVKQHLAAREVQDVDEYCRGKNEILLKILKGAGWNEEELEEVRKANE